MFIQINNSKYYLAALYTDNKGGFNADIEHADGKSFTINYSAITSKFYKNGKNAKLPIFLCKAVLEMAINRGGLVYMNEVEKENALYWLKN